MGLRSLDLSSILSGAPGRVGEESWREEKRRARGAGKEGLTWNCQEAERGVVQAGNRRTVRVPVDKMNGTKTPPPTQINTHRPVRLDKLGKAEDRDRDSTSQERKKRKDRSTNKDEVGYFVSLHSIF